MNVSDILSNSTICDQQLNAHTMAEMDVEIRRQMNPKQTFIRKIVVIVYCSVIFYM